MTSMMAVIPALKQLTNVQNMLQRGLASSDRLFHVLDAEDEPDSSRVPLERAKGLKSNSATWSRATRASRSRRWTTSASSRARAR